MIEIKEKLRFNSFWTKWRKNLDTMVAARGGKLLCPASTDLEFIETQGGYIAKPRWAICLLSLPQKGNSTETNHKLVVFISGSFRFSRDPDHPNETRLTGVDSHVAFFKPQKGNLGSGVSLDLIDAYHFDHFVDDPKLSAPHPVFHAQRNIRGDDVFPMFSEALRKDPTNNMVIGEIAQERKNQLFGLKTFRLPTPQVDLFSLSVILAADHLVDKCSHDSSTYKTFKSLLQFVSTNQPELVYVKHLPNIRANAAVAENRFVWQWYATH